MPTIRAHVEVLEELGSDAHVFFQVDAPPMTAEVLETASEEGLLPADRALFTARVDARTAARVGAELELAVDPCGLPLLRSRQWRAARDGRRRARPGGALTKQRETRERVLELIEPLSVGDAIPSERQLGIDLGVSRLTVRAALDELVREGYLVRRRGAGTFVAEPKVAKGIDITSFSDDMRARGLTPGQPHARPPRDRRRRAARPHPPRLAVRAGGRGQAAAPRRRRPDGDRAAARPLVARSRPVRRATSRSIRSTTCSRAATTSRSSAARRRSSRP